MKRSFTITDLPKEERPRERLEKFGPETLSAPELLALILGNGINGESIIVTAQKLLSKFGSLSALNDASFEDLKEIKGLGQAKVAQLKACFEIARRINTNNRFDISGRAKQVVSSKDVYQLVKSKIKNYAKEHYFVLSFNSRNQLLGIDEISVGTLDTNLVHPRETFEAAIRRHASRIILTHNHPSGDTEPSEEDLEITRELVDAGKVMGIEVLDHLIVGDGFKSLL